MIPRTPSPQAIVVCVALLLAACQGGESAPTATTLPPVTPPDVRMSLTVSATEITLGDSVRLQWQATAATACTATGGWSGVRGIAGDETITLAQTGVHTFTLRCTGAGVPAERSATLTVRPVVPPPLQDVLLDFSGAPLTLELGSPVTLSWIATHAETCTAAGAWSGTKPVSGSEPVTPALLGSNVYRLSCTGTGAPDESSVTVTVNDPHAASHAEFLRLRALENLP